VIVLFYDELFYERISDLSDKNQIIMILENSKKGFKDIILNFYVLILAAMLLLTWISYFLYLSSYVGYSDLGDLFIHILGFPIALFVPFISEITASGYILAYARIFAYANLLLIITLFAGLFLSYRGVKIYNYSLENIALNHIKQLKEELSSATAITGYDDGRE
jgi:hypothetical protein